MSVEETTDYPLVVALRSRDSRLADQAIHLIAQSSRILEYTISTFPGGTDHTERHTKMVEKIARMVLSDEFLSELTDHEIFFLAVSCHYHDLAMAGNDADDRSAKSRDQVRRDHAIRVGDIIAEKWAELGFITRRVAQILGEICRGHRPARNAEGIENWDDLNSIEILEPGVSVRVRLMSALIYAIDELHLGSDRASERVQEWRNIADDESRRHWRRHQAISGPVKHQKGSLLFQVSADTPEFEKDLRRHVFRKACSALCALRSQAAIEGISSPLPTITIQWDRQRTWELFLVEVCSDLTQRSMDGIADEMLARFRASATGRIELDDFCEEIGNSESELRSSLLRVSTAASIKGHLVKTEGELVELSQAHSDLFFERAMDADNRDLLFAGWYRKSWKKALFLNQFGRKYVQASVFPLVDQAYSVRMDQRQVNDPIRVLLESCPTAAELARDYAPAINNLVKEPLLALAALTGALIDLHGDPEQILDGRVRAAVRNLARSNESIVPTVSLLEELALIGGFTPEQVSESMIPDIPPDVALLPHPITIEISQSLPVDDVNSQLPRLMLASRRAGTPIKVRATDQYDLTLKITGDSEHQSPESGCELTFGPSSENASIGVRLPAKVEVNLTTRTIRFTLGQLRTAEPTPYPFFVSLSPPKPETPARGDFSASVNIPELTVRDVRSIVAARQLMREKPTRIELFFEDNEQLRASSECPIGSNFIAWNDAGDDYQKAIRGLPNHTLIPSLLKSSEIMRIASLKTSDRESAWLNLRKQAVQQVSAVYIRMVTVDGRPYDEQFVRYLPFTFIGPPTVDESSATMTNHELESKWNSGDEAFMITGYFGPSMHELAQNLREWCKETRAPFPFTFSMEAPSDLVTRTIMTIRILQSRDRIWHHDRPVIFEFRPVNRQESYRIEAEYWKQKGDEPRAKLAQEIADRISTPQPTQA